MAGNALGCGVGRLITHLLLLIAACACSLYILLHMPHTVGELSEQLLQAELDLPRRTTPRLKAHHNTSSPRRTVVRQWNAWKQQAERDAKKPGRCRPFRYLFDQAPRHGCMVDESVSIPFCRMEQLRINVANIESPVGGEELSTVMGRAEEVEYPKYLPGALTISKPLQGVPADVQQQTFYYLRDVLSAVTVERAACAETWPGTTLFLTRYEYVNLYHTMTDFFNAFFSYPNDDDNDDNPVNLVFLDAHAKGNLDPVWQQVYGNVTFVKQLPTGGVCFERAVFIPPGYVSPLYPKTGRVVCPNPIMMQDFCNHYMTSYHLDHVQMQPGKIVIIDRVPYIAHPRSKPKNAERVVHNMKHLPAYLLKVPNVKSVSVVHFEELTFAEQLQAVREAHILIGNHGAGLTHMVFMSDGSHVMEFGARLPFFTTLSRWKPNVGHHVLQGVSGFLSDDYITTVLIPAIERVLR